MEDFFYPICCHLSHTFFAIGMIRLFSSDLPFFFLNFIFALRTAFWSQDTFLVYT